jgi:hypothetical protein
MSDPSIAMTEAVKQFSQSTVEYLPYNSPVHSFQLRAYERGMRARSNQPHDDLRALRREHDDALRDLNTSKDQT